MELSYKSKKLERSLNDDRQMLKSYGSRATKLKQRMKELRSADFLSELEKAKMPQLRLHQHQGDRKGIWTIDIHKNWRICFELDHNPIPQLEDGGINLTEITAIKILLVEDPH